MDLYDIAKYGGPIVGGLGATSVYQTIRDMRDINKMASMGNYSPSNPMPQEFMNKLRGAWTPSSTFEKTGYPTGFKNWFFSRSSPQHFGPVEKMMSWGKAGLPYLKQGAKFLKKAPGIGFVSDALFGTTYTADTARDINNLLGVNTSPNVNQGGGGQGRGSSTGPGQTRGPVGMGSAPIRSAPRGPDLRNRANGGIISLWQR
jgi:hypothetical protein